MLMYYSQCNTAMRYALVLNSCRRSSVQSEKLVEVRDRCRRKGRAVNRGPTPQTVLLSRTASGDVVASGATIVRSWSLLAKRVLRQEARGPCVCPPECRPQRSRDRSLLKTHNTGLNKCTRTSFVFHE